jgi:hypothetical protein
MCGPSSMRFAYMWHEVCGKDSARSLVQIKFVAHLVSMRFVVR